MNRIDRLAIFGACVILFWFGTSGCVKRTRVVTKPREDQVLGGNRGYLLGTPPPSERETPPTRTYYETEIEIPTIEMHMVLPKWRREWHDKELYGNRGYLVGGPAQASIGRPAPAPAPAASPKRPSSLETPRRPAAPKPVFEEEEEEEITYDSYTVQKGDTLGDISGRLYGTSRAWKRIYEANRDILKDPNTLGTGQVLRIPRGEEPKKGSPSGTIK